VKRRLPARIAGACVVLVSCLAAPLTPAHAYEGQDGNSADPSRLAAVRNATASFLDLTAAQADGFTFLLPTKAGVTCIDNPGTGAMGEHYVNGDRVGDGMVQAEKPDVLLYAPQADGSRKLTGVEYVVFVGAWIKHHSSPPVLFGREFSLTGADNPFGLPPYYSLHAWAWQNNPSGAFSAWNPTVSCA
jgi:hypothetical protein